MPAKLLSAACNASVVTREANARQVKDGVWHPRHEHALQLCDRRIGWNCDVCRARDRAPRYRCVTGCDWDSCAACIVQSPDLAAKPLPVEPVPTGVATAVVQPADGGTCITLPLHLIRTGSMPVKAAERLASTYSEASSASATDSMLHALVRLWERVVLQSRVAMLHRIQSAPAPGGTGLESAVVQSFVQHALFLLKLESAHRTAMVPKTESWLFPSPEDATPDQQPNAPSQPSRFLLRGTSVDDTALSGDAMTTAVERSISHSPHTPRRKLRAELMRAKSVGYATSVDDRACDVPASSHEPPLARASASLRMAPLRSAILLPQVARSHCMLRTHCLQALAFAAGSMSLEAATQHLFTSNVRAILRAVALAYLDKDLRMCRNESELYDIVWFANPSRCSASTKNNSGCCGRG